MEIKIYKSYEEMSKGAADFMAEYINENRDALLCFAAGNSPEGAYNYLAKANKEQSLDISNNKMVSLDEWLGIDKYNTGSCIYFIMEKLIKPLKIKEENTCLFNGTAEDGKSECSRIDQFVREHGPIGLMVIGIGMNGHIALNEPGTSLELYSHTVELDEITKKVAQKYFDGPQPLYGGITLGLKHLMESKTLVVMANGDKKAEVMRRSLQGEVSEDFPASIIQTHPNCIVFLDEEAANKLQ